VNSWVKKKNEKDIKELQGIRGEILALSFPLLPFSLISWNQNVSKNLQE